MLLYLSTSNEYHIKCRPATTNVTCNLSFNQQSTTSQPKYGNTQQQILTSITINRDASERESSDNYTTTYSKEHKQFMTNKKMSQIQLLLFCAILGVGAAKNHTREGNNSYVPQTITSDVDLQLNLLRDNILLIQEKLENHIKAQCKQTN